VIANKHYRFSSGFTLIELLVSIAIIGILAAIVLVAINPTKQLNDARDAKRRVDLKTLIDGVYQYQIDNSELPKYQLNGVDTILVDTPRYICRRNDPITCFGLSYVDLGTLSGSYISSMPIDPQGESIHHTDYRIWIDTDGRLHTDAPLGNDGAGLSATR